MNLDPFDSPGNPGGSTEVERDRWGRPLVVPPTGGGPIPYTRTTTYVGCLEDTYNLSRWQQRMVAVGLADRPDLVLAVGAHRDDRDKLNQLVDDAMEAAKAHAAAEIGTALHKLTEPLDLGQTLGVVPEAYRADLEAYRRATARLEVVGIERFTVLDDLRVAGTHDRTVRFQGREFIADIKTGSIEYGALKIAMQLSVYAHSVLYDPATRERAPLEVDQERAIVIHLPAGQGRCELHWVDIAAGWEAVQVATMVRAWRSRKGLFTAFDLPDPAEEIAAAATVEELGAIWQRANALGRWTDDLTQRAATRKAELVGGSA
ncbi:PD-(D/E)XK nuclease family protein [Nonomuraea sediminis]|uniref:PD-(D/E)XK nuclease family protein n=1 Tax=Nonomuraea sediminis TaxID=2835864 RepID=UPI001BDBF044|nr:PD-(D/E)XK nuclease family protein [Nonomuraea sediminis]